MCSQSESNSWQPDAQVGRNESTVWLRAGVDAARSGDPQQARELLLRVIQADERCLQAWYWLSRVVEDLDEREICLENVLVLDPAHTAVQAELADLRRERAEAATASPLPREALETATPQTAAERLAAREAVGALPCPYCRSPSSAQDRHCPVCEGSLWVRERKAKGHSASSLGLVAVWLAVANYLWLGVALGYLFVGLCTGLAGSVGASGALETVGQLLGLKAVTVPQAPRPVAPSLVLGAGAFLFSLFVAWGLYQRLRFFYWFTVALIALSPLLIAYQTMNGTIAWAGAVFFGVLFLLAVSLAFAAYDQFAWVDERLAATLDRDVDSASSLYARGQAHAQGGMWARAALHWSKAVALDPGHPEYRLALALAQINLGQPSLAREHLSEVQKIDPTHPQLADLLAQAGETPA